MKELRMKERAECREIGGTVHSPRARKSRAITQD